MVCQKITKVQENQIESKRVSMNRRERRSKQLRKAERNRGCPLILFLFPVFTHVA